MNLMLWGVIPMGSVDRDIRLIKNGEEIEHEKNIFYIY